jgi:Zn ribbon nucleic-acid-binding protein
MKYIKAIIWWMENGINKRIILCIVCGKQKQKKIKQNRNNIKPLNEQTSWTMLNEKIKIKQDFLSSKLNETKYYKDFLQKIFSKSLRNEHITLYWIFKEI